MSLKDDIINKMKEFHNQKFSFDKVDSIPTVHTKQLTFGCTGWSFDAVVLYIDMRHSTKLLDEHRRKVGIGGDDITKDLIWLGNILLLLSLVCCIIKRYGYYAGQYHLLSSILLLLFCFLRNNDNFDYDVGEKGKKDW